MVINLGMNWENFYKDNIMSYIKSLQANPFELVTLILDLAIVMFLVYCFFKIVRGSRAWQLIKGIALLIIATWVSGLFNLKILNWILTGIMNLGVIAIIVIFQPELRRGLEQLGTNKLTKFFGIDKDVSTKTKEDIYKVVIAATELAKTKTGALIVFERDIKIQDIIATGIPMNAEVSPQLLVNIFEPKTPLHDGAVVISGNKIAAAACVLPLADDKDIAKELGTRHRAAIGISKESDAIAIVVPGFDNNPAEAPETIELEGVTYKIYKATKGGEFIGAAVESSANGFGGALNVLVGFDKEGNIIDYSLLSHAETPGLGSKAADWFKKGGKGDITGMNPGQKALVVNKDGGQIDAITASTITTRAFLKAVNNAYAAYSGQNVDGSSGATQQVSETAADAPKAAKAQCEGTQDCCGQACDSAACKAACGGKCDPANCDKADCKKAECPKQDCKNKK